MIRVARTRSDGSSFAALTAPGVPTVTTAAP